MMVSDRFDRLVRAVGPDGLSRLHASLVTIVSDDSIGKYFALPFAASGIPLRLISSSKSQGEKLLDMNLAEGYSVRSLQPALAALGGYGAQAKISALTEGLNYSGSSLLMRNSSAVIDCTSSPVSKQLCFEYCSRNKIPFIDAAVFPGHGQIQVFTDGRCYVTPDGLALKPAPGHDPDKQLGRAATKELIGLFFGGIAADEAVRSILGQEEPIESLHLTFGYGAELFRPLGDREPKILRPEDYRDVRALAFGAGAVGSATALPLALMGVGRIDFLDYDITELSNEVKTILLYNRAGEAKAAVSAERIMSLTDGRTQAGAIEMMLDDGWVPDQPYTVFVDGFDNFYSRWLVHEITIATGTPLISASGRYDGFDYRLFVPGRTICFDCNFRIAERGREDYARRRQSCELEYTPQNIWMNQSVGALAALSLPNILFPERYGPAVNGLVSYESVASFRASVDHRDNVCRIGDGGVYHNVPI